MYASNQILVGLAVAWLFATKIEQVVSRNLSCLRVDERVL